jgi:hypothetical protein
LDAPDFGRGFALPKLGIFSLFLFYDNEHGQSKPELISFFAITMFVVAV